MQLFEIVSGFSPEREERRIPLPPSVIATSWQVMPLRSPTAAAYGVRLPGSASLFPSLPSLPSRESSGRAYPIPRSPAPPSSATRPFHICYDEAQADVPLTQLGTSLAQGLICSSVRLGEIHFAAAVSALFEWVGMRSDRGDAMHQAATKRSGNWIYDEHLTGVRCCGLLGLVVPFQIAVVSMLYYGGILRSARHQTQAG